MRGIIDETDATLQAPGRHSTVSHTHTKVQKGWCITGASVKRSAQTLVVRETLLPTETVIDIPFQEHAFCKTLSVAPHAFVLPAPNAFLLPKAEPRVCFRQHLC